MTKEELEKEAEAYALEWGDKTDGTYACCRDAYLASAEPREKQIAELEKACDETEELLDKQIEAIYKVVEELNEAKKIILTLLNTFAYPIGREDWTMEDIEVINRAEKFLEE